MRYLAYSDYKSYIQQVHFKELVQGDDSKRLEAEDSALAIVVSHLKQKYDIDREFTETLPWDVTKVYKAGDRITIDFDAYSTSSTYALNALVVYASKGYICTTAVTQAEAFDISKWALLGAQYAIYFAVYPPTCTYPVTLSDKDGPVFNYKNVYVENDIVFWKNKTYKCARGTSGISHTSLINYYTYANIPHVNVFPDDAINNKNGQYWNTATPYSVPAGTRPTNTVYWKLGDNRDKQIVLYMKWLVVDILAPLIAPTNVPDYWCTNAAKAKYELENMANGMSTPDMPVLQPAQGTRVRHGGNVKLKNTY